MLPTGTPDEVSFETRRLMPSAFGDISRSHRDVLERRKRRVVQVVVVAVFAGAVVVAAVSARSGVSLLVAMLLFVALVPGIAAVSFVLGVLYHLRRASRELASRLTSPDWQARLSAQTVSEQVSLKVLDSGVLLSRGADEARLVGFQRIGIHRSADGVIIEVSGEHLTVPAEAFVSRDAFEAFVLGLMGRVASASSRDRCQN